MIAVSHPLSAASFFWDGASAGPDADGGSGSWDTTSANWKTAATAGDSVTWPVDGWEAEAFFGAAPGIVTIDPAGIEARHLNFTSTGYTISGGTLDLVGIIPLATVGSGLSATISAPISGTLTKRGTGTLILSGASTAFLGDQHEGVLELEAGAWSVGPGFRLTAFGSGTLSAQKSTKIESTGSLQLTSVSASRTATFELRDAAELSVDGNLQTNRGGGTEIGSLSVLNFSKLIVNGSLDVGKNMAGANDRSRGLLATNGNAQATVSGSTRLSNSGDNNHGTATLSVLGNSSFTTDTLELRPRREKGAQILAVVNNTATLTATNGVILTTADLINSNIATTTNLRVAGSGTLATPSIVAHANSGNTTIQLQLNGGTVKALANNPTFISGFTNAPVINQNGITFDTNGFNVGLSVGLAGADGFLTKTGLGTLTLNAPATYAGSTTVSQGTLALSGTASLASDAVAVAPGAVLGGSGTIGGSAAVEGTVAPGHPLGTLTVNGSLSLTSSATLEADVNISGTAQVETATATGVAVDDGMVEVTVTGDGISGSPLTIEVAVESGDDEIEWAAKVRQALAAASAVTDLYAVGGSGSFIALSGLAPATNDATLNIAIGNGFPDPGITPAAASADTIPGTLPGNDQLAVAGELAIDGATLNLNIAGTPEAPAYVIATYGSRDGTFATVNGLPAGYSLAYNHNEGTAIALVSDDGSPPPLSPFEQWIAGFSVGGQTAAGDDPDGDGAPNFMEFALDSDPSDSSSQAKVFVKLATVDATADVLTLTAAVRSSATFAADGNNQKAVAGADQLTYHVEAAATLDDWGSQAVTMVTGADAAAIQAGLPDPSAGWSYRTFRTSGSALGDPRKFIRLRVTTP
jgi:autotransporter-associated beta strand protein